MSEQPKTVRVRLAVAVSSEGEWSSAGWGQPGRPARKDSELSSSALEGLEGAGGEVVHFIEADLPLPVSQTIQAEVV